MYTLNLACQFEVHKCLLILIPFPGTLSSQPHCHSAAGHFWIWGSFVFMETCSSGFFSTPWLRLFSCWRRSQKQHDRYHYKVLPNKLNSPFLFLFSPLFPTHHPMAVWSGFFHFYSSWELTSSLLRHWAWNIYICLLEANPFLCVQSLLPTVPRPHSHMWPWLWALLSSHFTSNITP